MINFHYTAVSQFTALDKLVSIPHQIQADTPGLVLGGLCPDFFGASKYCSYNISYTQ